MNYENIEQQQPSEDADFERSLGASDAAPQTMEIRVDATSQSINDFLEDEQRRANDRKRFINMLMQKKAQSETAHRKAIAEQEELHVHSQAKIDAQLKMLGYEPEPTWVLPKATSSPAAPVVDRMAKARAARKAKIVAAAAPAAAPAKGKRTISDQTKAKMAAARALYWKKQKAAAKKAAKAK